MSGFDTVLSDYGLIIFLVVGATTYAILAGLAARLRPRSAAIIGIAVAGIPIAVAVSSLVILLLMLGYSSSAVINVITRSPSGFLAYVVETGAEFSIFGFASIVAFLVIQFRKRRVLTD